MHVAIDARMLYTTGIGRYLRELLDGLARLDTGHTFTVLVRPEDRNRWISPGPRFTIEEVDAEIYGFNEQVRLARVLRRIDADLVHFASFNAPLAYRGPRVTTIHDLTLLDHSTARGSMARRCTYVVKQAVVRHQIRSVVARSELVLTVSRYVRDDLVRRRMVDPERVLCIYNGVPAEAYAEPVPVSGIETPYLFHLGTFYPYKNLITLVRALPLIRRDHPELRLVLAGHHEGLDSEVRALIGRLGLHDQILLPGFVSDGEAAWLYRHAAMYVLPSLSEGFGLPGLAAMSQGVPVAAARATSLPEVYGDAAVFFDPNDASDLARTVAEALADAEVVNGLRRAGLQRVEQFSWARLAEETAGAYEEALAARTRRSGRIRRAGNVSSR